MRTKRSYKQTFCRYNFGAKPVAEQTVEVVLTTTIPFDNEHIDQFDRVFWAAMWEQAPHFRDPTKPKVSSAGWSSVMPDGPIVEVTGDVVHSKKDKRRKSAKTTKGRHHASKTAGRRKRGA